MYRQFVLGRCTFELCYWPARSSVGFLAGTLAYFVSGFFYMVGLRLCDAPSRCRHFRADMTPQGVIDLYHFVVGPTHIIYFCNHTKHEYLIVSSRGMNAILGSGSGPNNVNWWWRLYDLKRHSSASNHSQTFRYSKISLVSKKRTFIGWKLLCWHWLCIRIILGLFIAIIDGLTKKPCRKKLLSFMMCASAL